MSVRAVNNAQDAQEQRGGRTSLSSWSLPVDLACHMVHRRIAVPCVLRPACVHEPCVMQVSVGRTQTCLHARDMDCPHHYPMYRVDPKSRLKISSQYKRTAPQQAKKKKISRSPSMYAYPQRRAMHPNKTHNAMPVMMLTSKSQPLQTTSSTARPVHSAAPPDCAQSSSTGTGTCPGTAQSPLCSPRRRP